MSEITRPASQEAATLRNSSAHWNASVRKPAARICRLSALRIEASSSMTAMSLRGVAIGMSVPAGVIRGRFPQGLVAGCQVLVFGCQMRMARRSPPRISQMPSAMGLTSRLAFARVRPRAAVARTLLRKVRLTVSQLEDPTSRIPVRSQIEFLNLAADALGDDMLGFNLAVDFDLRDAGLFYYVLASSGRLVDVFARGARYSTVVNEGFVQKFIDDRRVGLAIRYADVP